MTTVALLTTALLIRRAFPNFYVFVMVIAAGAAVLL